MPEKQIEDLLTDDSFVKWITGCASAEEHKYWENWVAKDEGHGDLVEQVKELIYLTDQGELTIPDPQIELKRLEASLDNYDQLKKKSKARVHKIRQPARFVGTIVAASVLVIMTLGFFFLFENDPQDISQEQVTKKHEFRTDFGEKITLKLSDGSSIVLNAKSHLKYSSSVRSGQNIDIWLNGEAYFDIAHLEGENQRFVTVHTPDGLVEVLGTQFVVKTSKKGTRTVLEKGKIKVKVRGDSQRPDSEHILKPGDLARFVSENKQIDLKTVNTSVYTSWIQDKWIFDQTPLADVVSRIEDTYGVKVIVQTHELQHELLSGSIKSTNLKILKDALSKILNEPVIQQNNTITIGKKVE